LQAINATEAAHFFGCTDVTYVTIKWDKRPNNHRQTLAQIPPNSHVMTLLRDDTNSFTAVNYYASVLPVLNKLNADLLIIGDVRPYAFTDLARSINAKTRVLVDDGTGTLVVYEYLVKSGKYYDLPKSSSPIRQAERDEQKRAMGIQVDATPPYDLFTCFDLPETQATKVHHQPCARFVFTHHELNYKQIAIAGAPLVELNKLSLSDYLSAIAAMTKNKDVEYLYIPHRNETKEKLDSLQEALPVKLLPIDRPIELWLKFHPNPPAKLYSIISTCLWNIHESQPSIQVKAFLPSRNAWQRGAQKEAWGIAGVTSVDSMLLIVDYFKNHLPHEEVSCHGN